MIPCALINAQEESTSQPPQDTTTNIIREYKIHPLTKKADSVFFDTTMLGFQIYNPAFEHDFAISYLGNTGQAMQSNYLNLRNTYSPFIFEKPFTAYFHDPYRISHYDTYKPFTQVQYETFGTREKSEQLIQAIHTQNISPFANIGILYDLIASRGIYLDQGTKENSFSIFGSYQRNIYSVFGNISLNKMSQAENGGLIDIPQFE